MDELYGLSLKQDLKDGSGLASKALAALGGMQIPRLLPRFKTSERSLGVGTWESTLSISSPRDSWAHSTLRTTSPRVVFGLK